MYKNAQSHIWAVLFGKGVQERMWYCSGSTCSQVQWCKCTPFITVMCTQTAHKVFPLPQSLVFNVVTPIFLSCNLMKLGSLLACNCSKLMILYGSTLCILLLFVMQLYTYQFGWAQIGCQEKFNRTKIV